MERAIDAGASGARAERDRLYEDFRPLVQRLVSRYGVTDELRQELPGEIYWRYTQLLNAYDPARGVPLRAYLVRMLSTTTYAFARSHWRRDQRHVSFESAPPIEMDTEDLETTVTEAWARAQLQSRLPEALAQLSARQRAIVVSRFYEGRSFEEIASSLEIRPVSVRSLLRYALSRMRAYLVIAEAGGEVPRKRTRRSAS